MRKVGAVTRAIDQATRYGAQILCDSMQCWYNFPITSAKICKMPAQYPDNSMQLQTTADDARQ